MYYEVGDIEEDEPSPHSRQPSCSDVDDSLQFYYAHCSSVRSVDSPTTPKSWNSRTRVAPCEASLIDDRLFLGDRRLATDRDELARLGIKYILNVSAEVPNFFPDDPYFVYFNIQLLDEATQILPVEEIGKAHQFIEHCIQQGNGSLLVHCAAGRSRSPTIVISYLMNKKKMSLLQAYQHVRKVRGCINPNISFLKALVCYDHHLQIMRCYSANHGLMNKEEQQAALVKQLQANALNSLCELCFPSFDPAVVRQTIEKHVRVDKFEISAIEKTLYSYYG